ncbi:hypothetical protein PInf_005694 [Phytophthora infestans]|nr:hypothetical protein PInf_005694 [Phytophthora infestans]
MMPVLGAATAATADQPVVKTPAEAFELVEASTLPDGVTFTGVTEKIDPPANAAAMIKKEAHDDKDDEKEQYGWGLGGLGSWELGGWGGWGGWGGYGPHRFGFMCGGVPGWAYPLGY